MAKQAARKQPLGPATRDAQRSHKEPILTQIASFVDLFVWLLILKSFFLPLFIIPTGSMAETLMGAHATYTCPNCGFEFPVNFPNNTIPNNVQCPNCRYQQETEPPTGAQLTMKAGDRIMVHGWPFVFGGDFGPHRWDVVVFKNPNQPDINYIKRLIGLPGETIEIIDGDVWVQEVGDEVPHVATKTPTAQRALWFPFYNQDYPPLEPTVDHAWQHLSLVTSRGTVKLPGPQWPPYDPHWVALDAEGGWTDLRTRTWHFDGLDREREAIQFVTTTGDSLKPVKLLDIYGYNGYVPRHNEVSDARLSATVEMLAGDGYVELTISKYDDYFFATLHADGKLTLEHAAEIDGPRELWSSTEVEIPARPLQLALGHADYHLIAEIDGRPVLVSSPEHYRIPVETARQREGRPAPETLRIAAARLDARFSHVAVHRDVHYVGGGFGNAQSNGTLGSPISLPDDAYFVCGDNSPFSHDSRRWSASELGPHLQPAFERGEYQIGTVPADQMIGRAFLVYWPGFLPLTEKGGNILPDLGRVRWID